jgi:hypothetical protein
MENWILIAIAIIFLVIPVLYMAYKLIRAATADKITFIKDDKSITISSKLGAEDRKKLLEF